MHRPIAVKKKQAWVGKGAARRRRQRRMPGVWASTHGIPCPAPCGAWKVLLRPTVKGCRALPEGMARSDSYRTAA
jgi:hypothetical protein